MTFDLFAPEEPEEAPKAAPAPKPAPEPSRPASALAQRPWASPRLQDDQPCRFYSDRGPYRCAVGGGTASGSMDGGRTWFCHGHRPWGYLPSEQDEGAPVQRRGF